MHTLIGLLFYQVICIVTDYVYFSSYTICRTLGSILIVQKQLNKQAPTMLVSLL